VKVKDYKDDVTGAVIDSLASEGRGYLTYEIVTEDRAGNTTFNTAVLKVDTKAPILTVSGIEEGKHYNTSPTLHIDNTEIGYAEKEAFISLSVEKDGEDAAYKFDSAASVDFSQFQGDGDYAITIFAKDAAGNRSSIHTLRFVKDTTPPVLSFLGADDGAYYNHDVAVIAAVNERYFESAGAFVSVVYTNDEGKKTGNDAFTVPLGDADSVLQKVFSGTNTATLTFTGSDEAGNISKPVSLTFTVDKTPPVITFDGNFDGVKGYDNPAGGKVSFEDDYKLTETVVITGGKGMAVTREEDGSFTVSDAEKTGVNDNVYTITARAEDKAGNVTEEKKQVVLCRFGSVMVWTDSSKAKRGGFYTKMDDGISAIEYSILAENNKAVAIITRDGEAVDGKITTQRSGENAVIHTISGLSFDGEGYHEVDIMTKDSAENTNIVSDKDGKLNFAVDKTPPTIAIVGVTSGDVHNAESINFHVSVTDNILKDVVSAEADGKEIPLSEDGAGTLQGGTNMTLTVTATDKAGNESKKTVENITVEKNAGKRLVGAVTGSSVVPVAIICIGAALVAGMLILFRKKPYLLLDSKRGYYYGNDEYGFDIENAKRFSKGGMKNVIRGNESLTSLEIGKDVEINNPVRGDVFDENAASHGSGPAGSFVGSSGSFAETLPHGTDVMPSTGVTAGTDIMPGTGVTAGTDVMASTGVMQGTDVMPSTDVVAGTDVMPSTDVVSGTETMSSDEMPWSGLPDSGQLPPDKY
jgi:hypothetical protein